MFETKTPGVRIDRLFMAIEMLREIALNEEVRSHFNLQHWVKNDIGFGSRSAHVDDLVVKDRRADGCVTAVPTECGFAACVCGWMGALPEFNAHGFCLAPDNDPNGTLIPVYHDAEGGGYARGWDAVEVFFGICHSDAERMFLASRYPEHHRDDPVAVALRIEEYIEGEVA